MKKIINSIASFVWVAIFGVLLSIPAFNSLLYWWIGLSWIFIIVKFDLKDSLSLLTSLTFFISAIILELSGLTLIAEKFARISLLLFILGYLQILIKFHKKK
jgi:hypothetical protein